MLPFVWVQTLVKSSAQCVATRENNSREKNRDIMSVNVCVFSVEKAQDFFFYQQQGETLNDILLKKSCSGASLGLIYLKITGRGWMFLFSESGFNHVFVNFTLLAISFGTSESRNFQLERAS